MCFRKIIACNMKLSLQSSLLWYNLFHKRHCATLVAVQVEFIFFSSQSWCWWTIPYWYCMVLRVFVDNTILVLHGIAGVGGQLLLDSHLFLLLLCHQCLARCPQCNARQHHAIPYHTISYLTIYRLPWFPAAQAMFQQMHPQWLSSAKPEWPNRRPHEKKDQCLDKFPWVRNTFLV